MKLASIPARVPVPFADQGTKNPIPVNSQIGVNDGAASYTDGFPPLTMTPIAAGGIPPAGGDFNGILNAITQSVRWACAGGQYSYDDTFSTAIGGYPKGALIQNAVGDVIWLNTTDENKTNPDTGTGWFPAIRHGLTTVALSGSNVTLTPAQAAKEAIVLTGALTANVQLIMPAWVETWLIVNNTTGNFTVSVKPAAGSGVNLAASTSSQVYSDGTNIYYGALMVRNNLAEIKAAGTNSQAAARQNIGCGTSATKDVVTSPTDTTAGRVLTVGYGGLGGYGTTILLTADQAKNPLTNGFYGVQADPTYGNAALISFGYDSGSQVHLIAKQGGQAPLIGIAGSNPQGVFGAWGKIYTEFQKPTAADVGALPIAGGTMTGAITTSSDGRGSFASQLGSKAPVYQEINTAATSEYWPIVKQKYIQGNSAWSMGVLVNAGRLQIYYSAPNNANDKNFSFQTDGQLILPNYANFDARYMGKTDAYTKTESDARYMGKTDAYTKTESDARYMGKTDAYTKTESDARYVTGVQFGAVIQVNAESYTAPAGHVLVGVVAHNGNYDTQIDAFKAKPIQRQINNQWVTIPG